MSGEGVNGIKKKTLNFSIVLPLSSVNDPPPSIPTENYVTPPPPILRSPLMKNKTGPFFDGLTNDTLR